MILPIAEVPARTYLRFLNMNRRIWHILVVMIGLLVLAGQGDLMAQKGKIKGKKKKNRKKGKVEMAVDSLKTDSLPQAGLPNVDSIAAAIAKGSAGRQDSDSVVKAPATTAQGAQAEAGKEKPEKQRNKYGHIKPDNMKPVHYRPMTQGNIDETRTRMLARRARLSNAREQLGDKGDWSKDRRMAADSMLQQGIAELDSVAQALDSLEQRWYRTDPIARQLTDTGQEAGGAGEDAIDEDDDGARDIDDDGDMPFVPKPGGKGKFKGKTPETDDGREADVDED